MTFKRDVRGCEGDKKDKAKWDNKKIEIFLKVCVEKVIVGNMPSTHFTKEGQKNVQQKFHEKASHNYDKTQLNIS